MPIASVLVHAGNDARTTERLEAATALARNHQAHLSGLYVLPTLELPAIARAYVSSEIIVMEAYRHSRAREWVVGGMTRHVFSHMTMPVLMSR